MKISGRKLLIKCCGSLLKSSLRWRCTGAKLSLDEYLAGVSDLPGGVQIPNRQIVFEELVMLWLANANPAFAPYLELFDDSALEKGTAYPEIISSLHDFFETQPRFGPDNQNLIDMLRSPAIAVPHSLTGQLEYIRTRWSILWVSIFTAC